ncbi:MAG: aconitase X swivel domain-containing protein [Planctomycetota bacterium]
MVTGRVIVAGAGQGELLRLTAPISFWGGVDPVAGLIADPRHPEYGASIAGKVLAVDSAVGSSSSSAIMLELIREGTAPAALLLGSADAIVALGVVVAGELGLDTLPVLEVPWDEIVSLPHGPIEVSADGTIRPMEPS